MLFFYSTQTQLSSFPYPYTTINKLNSHDHKKINVLHSKVLVLRVGMTRYLSPLKLNSVESNVSSKPSVNLPSTPPSTITAQTVTHRLLPQNRLRRLEADDETIGSFQKTTTDVWDVRGDTALRPRTKTPKRRQFPLYKSYGEPSPLIKDLTQVRFFLEDIKPLHSSRSCVGLTVVVIYGKHWRPRVPK